MPVWRVLIRQPHISPQGFVFSAPIIAALLKYNIELLAHFYFLKHSRGRTALGISPIQVATWHSMPHLRAVTRHPLFTLAGSSIHKRSASRWQPRDISQAVRYPLKLGSAS
jgi:hypothetical protein